MKHPQLRVLLEAIEPRTLLAAVAPTAYEQYFLELLNRARLDPSAEAHRLGIDLNEGLGGNVLSSAARQPLVMNAFLTDAARQHAAWLRQQSQIGHIGPDDSTPDTRAQAAGFVATEAELDALEETLGLLLNTSEGDLALRTEQLYRNLFLDDTATPGAAQRVALLDSSMRETGAGLASGAFDYESQAWQALVGVQLFASRAGHPSLTGVVFSDAVAINSFYTPGEGLASASVTAVNLSTGQTYSTSTNAAGGYALQVPPGTYKLTASSGGLSGAYESVVVAGDNVKRDFVTRAASGSDDLRALVPSPDVSAATFNRGLLRVDGGDAADTIVVAQEGSVIRVEVNGVQKLFSASKVTRIAVYGGGGSDNIRVEQIAMGVTLFGEAGNDTLSGGAGPDLLSGGDGNDSLLGYDGDDTAYGGDGDDSLSGGGDFLYGEAGNDNLTGGASKNRLFGGDGDDRLSGSNGADILYGEAGNDRLYGNGGNDTLDGGGGTDRLYGGDGNDLLIGGSSNDRLYGDAGDDILHGKHGNDIFQGGPGNDRAVDWVLGETRLDIELW